MNDACSVMTKGTPRRSAKPPTPRRPESRVGVDDLGAANRVVKRLQYALALGDRVGRRMPDPLPAIATRRRADRPGRSQPIG